MQRDEDDDEGMLLDLLKSGGIIVNCFHWEKSWPKEAQDAIALAVNCNNLFGPGADAEGIFHSDLRRVWEMHTSDPKLGLLAWCIWKRQELPWSKGKKWFENSKWNVADLAARR